jgi:hypothetical protein
MEKKKLPDLQITELFLVKCGEDWTRTFIGEIIREKTVDGMEFIYGNVVINEGKAWSVGSTEEELGTYLDDICTMKLDYNLNSSAGVTTQIFGEDFFLN